MEGKRFLRPLCVILTVLYALNGVYIVIKRALVALIERFSATSATVFISGSSVAELWLFTLGTGICLLCAALLVSGRLRAAFFVLAGAQAAVALGNLLSPIFQADAMRFSLCVMVVSACCTILGYALLAHTESTKELCAIGWLCAGLAGVNQLCAALSIFSVIMMDSGTQSLWFEIFVRTARISSVLSIVATIAQALCFVLVLFTIQRTKSAEVPLSDAGQELPTQEETARENSAESADGEDAASGTKVQAVLEPAEPEKPAENK